MSQAQTPKQAQGDAPPHRYNAALAQTIESRWQTFWREHKSFYSPNPGEPGFDASRPKQYVLDMFPYPSGVGLHVGHPLGYIATDIYARYLRMAGYNVLHTMGFDSFGLPAEQFALQTGTHPRVSTEANIATMRAQLTRLGLGHDPHRSVSTTDPEFYKWTQWIFLQIYNSWYDGSALDGKARPISELVKALESGRVKTASGRTWSSLSKDEQRSETDSRRLAFLAEVPVNWCPMLGTVLANEEVTAEGRSERGNFPVYKRPLRQWMMRITAYAERLLSDLEKVDWPEPIKLMQRNWIGRSEGAWVDFAVGLGTQTQSKIRVFTTRPDTIFGATYMVLSPEHPMVDDLTPEAWDSNKKGHIPPQWRGSFPGAPAFGYQTPREAVEGYRSYARSRTDEQRTEGKVKTGVFTGAFATNPATGAQIPIFIADYVLMGYGTGAIMAVPAHDERDFEFARTMDLPIRDVVYPRHVMAIRHFAQEVHPAGSTSTPDWRNELADFLGVVTKSSPDASFDDLLRIVREGRAPEQEAQTGPRGATRAEWLEAIDDLRVKSLDELRDLFASAGYYAQSGFPYAGPGTAANSSGPHFTLTGLHTPEAKKAACQAIEKQGLGQAAVTYKLRDWLFSRQRYWGEPFPIVYDQQGHAHAVPESMLPVLLPELENFQPETSEDPNAPVVTPLNRAKEWVTATLDLGDGPKKYTRETNTMPNWAGSCWYYLRYLDPTDAKSFCDPKVEKYWMGGRSTLRADRETPDIYETKLDGESLDRLNDDTKLRPIGFVPRDPYPPGMYGAVDDLQVTSRNLPHFDLPGATYFVTWRTKEGRVLGDADRDKVVSALMHFDGQKCRSYALCVMPDHIHWIVRPYDGVSLTELVSSVKRFSAKAINTSNDAEGSLWQPDRFDHIVRHGGWFAQFLRYVVRNPVEAGLVRAPSEYKWTRVHSDVQLADTEGLSSSTPNGRLGEPTYPIGGVDLYVGGVEHAVLHLLYARFWHKVLFDLGRVSTPEPFQKLFNQGYIQAAAYTDRRGIYVEASAVTEGDEVSIEVDELDLSSGAVEPIKRSTTFFYNDEPVFREYGKMGKSLKNAVSPDEVFAEYGCDTMRLYEMAMGPLEASKPWNTRDIAGSHRFLQRVWRNLVDENTGLSRCVTTPADRATLRILHKTIIGVRRDMESLGFNTVVSKLIELNNHLATLPAVPLEVAAPLILMLTPMAPHTGEELWHRVMRAAKHPETAPASIIHERFPIADEKLAADDQVEIPVSINGKLRSKVSVPAGADAAAIEAAAKSDPRVIELIEGKAIKKTIVVPGRMVNFVV